MWKDSLHNNPFEFFNLKTFKPKKFNISLTDSRFSFKRIGQLKYEFVIMFIMTSNYCMYYVQKSSYLTHYA